VNKFQLLARNRFAVAKFMGVQNCSSDYSELGCRSKLSIRSLCFKCSIWLIILFTMIGSIRY